MTRRQLRRHARRHPALAAVAVLLALVVLGAIVRDAGGLVILAAIAAAAYYAGKHSRPVARAVARPLPSAPPWPSPPLGMVPAAERDRLAAELADAQARLAAAYAAGRDMLAGHNRETAALRAELDGARASAVAAWDAAAERPPARPWECPECHSLFERPGFDHEPCRARRAALLGDPRSGARPLVDA